MSIAVLSNVNMEPMKIFLERSFSKAYFVGYNQYLAELLNKTSRLNNYKFDVILLFLDGEEYLKSYTDKLSTLEDIKDEINVNIKQLLAAINDFLANEKNKNSLFVINTLTVNPYMFNTFLERNTNYSFLEITDFVNRRIIEFKKQLNNVLILDWGRIINSFGHFNLYDTKFWYLGRIKYNNTAFKALAKNLKQLTNAYKGKTKKVLVLDLDNTLWQGIVGEGGIKLSEDGMEKAYRDFQKLLKSLKNMGIILTIVSKNNYEDVKEVFETHPMMVLKSDDFVSMKINWKDKVTNIKELALELNLGLDSFVFIDDNPVEREIVRVHIPEVTVPNFPDDVVDLPNWFVKEVIYNHFSKVYITNEDGDKTKQYRNGIKRQQIAESLDLDGFIESLGIKTKFYINDKRFIERTAQQTQKTNQFNLTTKRYTSADVEQFMHSDTYLVFNLEYEDRFGNEGIVATAILVIENGKAIVGTFLMSCRVIGRNVEYGFLNEIVDYVKRCHNNITALFAEYLPTKKNILTEHFYENCGFDVIEVCENGGRRYKLALRN